MDFTFLLKIGCLVTIPETAVITWFCFRFFGLRPRRFPVRLAAVTVAASILIVISLALFQPLVHPLAAAMLYFAVLSGLFPEIAWRIRLFLTLVTCLLNFFVEMASVILRPLIGEPVDIVAGPVYHILLAYWPGMALFALAALLLEWSGRAPGRRVLQLMMHERNRYLQYYAGIVFIQCFTLVMLFVARYFHHEHEAASGLFYIGILAVIIVTFLTIRLIAKARDEAIRATQDAFVGDLMQMITTIRGQRHDFVNHVQTMYSMLTMNKLDQLKQYMEEVAGEIQSVSLLTNQIPTTALGSLLAAKQAIAQTKNIRFKYRMAELPDAMTAVRSIDLVRIVGNLVDNAFDEVMKRSADARVVTLNMETSDRELCISVSNSGDPLTKDEQRRIFTPGYSTKDGGHAGLGLPIVVERVRHYGGRVEIGFQPEHGVIFTARIPIDSSAQYIG